MAPLLKKSLNLSNSSLMLRALMYVASLQTFSLASSLLYRRLELEDRDQSWAVSRPNMLQLTVSGDIITGVRQGLL
jgi:hypothetical protein